MLAISRSFLALYNKRPSFNKKQKILNSCGERGSKGHLFSELGDLVVFHQTKTMMVSFTKPKSCDLFNPLSKNSVTNFYLENFGACVLSQKYLIFLFQNHVFSIFQFSHLMHVVIPTKSNSIHSSLMVHVDALKILQTATLSIVS